MVILECFDYNQHFVAMMNIINRAKRENLEGKFELHHIIPKCFYKVKNIEINNGADNLVKLTREQHCKVHHLAMLCAKEFIRNKLTMAYRFMSNTKSCLGESNPNYGKHLSDETKRKISEALKGEKNPMYDKPGTMKDKHFSEEHRHKISASMKGKNRGKNSPIYGKHRSDETKHKISTGHKGKTFTDEHRKKLSDARKIYWAQRRGGINAAT